MRWLALLLCACGAPAASGISLQTELTGVTGVDVFLVSSSQPCATFGSEPLALRSDITIDAFARVDAGSAAAFSNLGDAPRLIIAEAYTEETRVGFGCTPSPMIERDKVASVVVRIEAL